MKSLTHISDRLRMTSLYADIIPQGQWLERSPEDWDEAKEQLATLRKDELDLRMLLSAAKGAWDMKLEGLHDFTSSVVRLGRVLFRASQSKLRVLDFVKPDAKSRVSIVGAGERLREVWKKLDASWTPGPALTLAALELSLAQCEAARQAHTTAETTWAFANALLAEFSGQVDDDCIAWYAHATAVLSPDTLWGKIIRKNMPTTTVPQPPPDQSEITKLELTGEGTLRLEFDAKHGTRFTVLYRGPGEAQSRALVVDVKEKFLELQNAAAGAHHFKVMASNSRGDGAESGEAVFEVPASQAA